MTQSSRSGTSRCSASQTADILRTGAPRFAPGLALDYIAKHALDFWLTTEDLPDPSNRVTVDRQGNIHLAKIYHNTEPHKRLLGKLKDLLGPARLPPTRASRAGRCSASRSRSPASRITAAPCASAPTPSSSALDVNCKAHDLDNLYVVDASFFPSSSAVNPALTTIANALRVGDHLLRAARRAAGGQQPGERERTSRRPDDPAALDRAAGCRALRAREIGVVGPGAIGGLLAARPSKAGHEVTVIATERTPLRLSSQALTLQKRSRAARDPTDREAVVDRSCRGAARHYEGERLT